MKPVPLIQQGKDCFRGGGEEQLQPLPGRLAWPLAGAVRHLLVGGDGEPPQLDPAHDFVRGR